MSKELEALNILRDNHIQFTKEKYRKLNKEKLQNIIKHKLARWNILEQALKRNEPMKVDLKTKYVLPYSVTYYACPKCDITIIKRYYNCCPHCGQKLDWNDDEIEKENEND